MRLEDELRALAVEWPPTPDLEAAVRARLPARRRRLRPPWALGAALVALAVAATPAATAVLELLGVAGGEEVRRAPRATPADLPPRTDPGTPTTLAGARALAGFPVRVPAALGTPREVLLDRDLPAVTLRWPQATLLALRGDAQVYARKMVGPATAVRRLRIGGEPALHLTGAPTTYLLQDQYGVPVEGTASRVDADVLLFSHGEVSYRLELPRGAGLRRALAIARSLG